jgi:hypothetical protein
MSNPFSIRLPLSLKAAVRARAASDGVSEATVIRKAVQAAVEG